VHTKLSDSQQPTPSVPETGKPKPNTNTSFVVVVESGAIKKIFYSRDNLVCTRLKAKENSDYRINGNTFNVVKLRCLLPSALADG
jgi:hypothetical protein